MKLAPPRESDHNRSKDFITPVKQASREMQSSRGAASPASINAISVASSSQFSAAVKRSKSIKFHDRFRGKIQMMNKEGHIGVVKQTNKPIEKVQPDSM